MCWRILLLVAVVAGASIHQDGSGKNSMIKPHRFQGDMVGKNVQKHQQERNAIAEDDWKWPRGVIPYVLSRKVSKYNLIN
ncbi:hypothetical protein LAZ67_6001286 [Cordylochernes scorpioides]|uniref:Secreted protein n=1 Tax=Cordylochernes scorpioides TaxID=51811 RepID=A0ABY6KJ35_9ARAC|nr:hypothetical protein LAZ67_6001286 [Cordylochernes scorpioides]